MKHVKYQRTFHLPHSKGRSKDDKSVDLFHVKRVYENQHVVITEKADGQNFTLYRDGVHARSLSSEHHPSQSYIKALHAQISWQIPDNMRIVGENLYAKHSIYYDALPDYFLVFGIYDGNYCLSWDDTVSICEMLGLKTVPVLYRGNYFCSEYASENFQRVTSALSTGESEGEGFVVRLEQRFLSGYGSSCILKWVRENHIQTNKHWSKEPLIINKLINNS